MKATYIYIYIYIYKNVKIAVPSQYLTNFWKTLEMTLINCEINFIVSWPAGGVISSGTRSTKFATTCKKFYGCNSR